MFINITTGVNRFTFNWDVSKYEKAVEIAKDNAISDIRVQETATGMTSEKIDETIIKCINDIINLVEACPGYTVDVFYIDITNQVLLYRLVTKLKETYPNARILSSITRKVKTYYTGANGKIVNKPTYVFKDFIDF